MHTTFSGVESIPPTHQSSSSPRFVHSASSRRRFVQSASPPVVKFLSSRAHEKHPSSRTPMFTSTFSSRLTKSIPVHGPHLNLPSLAFHGFRSVPISDDRWGTRTTLRTRHTPRIPQQFYGHFQVSRLSIFRCASCKVYDPAKLYFFQLKHSTGTLMRSLFSTIWSTMTDEYNKTCVKLHALLVPGRQEFRAAECLSRYSSAVTIRLPALNNNDRHQPNSLQMGRDVAWANSWCMPRGWISTQSLGTRNYSPYGRMQLSTCLVYDGSGFGK